MSYLLLTTELGDFAIRALERPGPNDWLALVVPAAESGAIATKLAEELSSIGDDEISSRSVSSVPSLVALTSEHPSGILVIAGFDAFGSADWQLIDRERSVLERPGATLLVLGSEAFSQLVEYAPNLASWLGAGAWRLAQKAPVLKAESRNERLSALRRWSGLKDSEVIAQAEQGQLPPDPPFSEWLVLLGRGDLLGK